MDRIESTIEVDATPNVCYSKWHHFEQFPHFMENVENVEQIDDKRWHWVVSGPLGHRSEWDAEIDGDEPGKFISWHSLTGSEINIAGIVNFRDLGQNKTEVSCQIQYDPPGGALGEIVAHIFANPQKMVEDNLENFKHLVEGTNVPVEKAHEGEVMQPNPFVVPTAQREPEISQTDTTIQAATSAVDSASTSAPSMPTGRIDEEGYELIYGLEDDIPFIGTSAEIDPEDIAELQSLSEEESPYLGTENGAIYSEDLIDMRNDSTVEISTIDIYTESMDINEEDLASFTEDLDDEIDIGMGPRETSEGFEAQQSENTGAGLGPRESLESTANENAVNSNPSTDRGAP